ncbi:fasciclin domain-containing protein [candidate division KSB1 bacterium]|nr:fasciclin domain-containing protein [candidate division KSB1 bacterium]
MTTTRNFLALALIILSANGAFAQSCGLGSGSSSVMPAAAQGAAKSSVEQDIMTVIKQESSLMMFAKLLKDTDLSNALQGTGPFTVFAPNDPAFSACSKEDQKAMGDKMMLATVLKYHVVSGQELTTADLAEMNGQALKALSGMDLLVTAKNGKISVGDANLVGQEINASNGVIYIVDTVNMPKMGATDVKK